MREFFSIVALGALINIGFAPVANAQIRVDSRMYTTAGSCAQCNLSDRTMTGMTLHDSNFSGSQFNRSNLSGGTFDRSDLSSTQFKRAFLARVKGTSVNMTEAVFHDATLTEAVFDKAVLIKSDLQRADLSRAEITHSDFAGADLSGVTAAHVNFAGSKFHNARFDRADLKDAKLDGADFSGADLSQARGLKQAQLDSACGNSETRLPIGLSLPYCDSAAQLEHDASAHDALDPQLRRAAKRLDRAIASVETLLSETPRTERKLRRRLQNIHADLTSSRRAVEHK